MSCRGGEGESTVSFDKRERKLILFFGPSINTFFKKFFCQSNKMNELERQKVTEALSAVSSELQTLEEFKKAV